MLSTPYTPPQTLTSAKEHSIPTCPLALPCLPQVSVEARLAQPHANEHMPRPGSSSTHTYMCAWQLAWGGVSAGKDKLFPWT